VSPRDWTDCDRTLENGLYHKVIALHGCKTWPLTALEEYNLVGYSNDFRHVMLRPQRDEVRKVWGKIQDEKIHCGQKLPAMNTVFWHMMQYATVNRYQRFGETFCLHLQDRKESNSGLYFPVLRTVNWQARVLDEYTDIMPRSRRYLKMLKQAENGGTLNAEKVLFIFHG